jgi:hypothetical protein
MMNTLNVSHLEPLLAEDFHYKSEGVFDEITSKQAFLDYIRPKLKSIAKLGELTNAEMGKHSCDPYRLEPVPCVVLTQGSKDSLLVATVFVKVKDGHIKHLFYSYDTVFVSRSGDYPGCNRCKVIQLFPPTFYDNHTVFPSRSGDYPGCKRCKVILLFPTRI